MIKDTPITEKIPQVLGGQCQELGTRPKIFFMLQYAFMYVCMYVVMYVQSLLCVFGVGFWSPLSGCQNPRMLKSLM